MRKNRFSVSQKSISLYVHIYPGKSIVDSVVKEFSELTISNVELYEFKK